MAVKASEGALQWEASIDTALLKKQIKDLNKELANIGVAKNMKLDEIAAFHQKQVKEVEKAQERMTRIVKEETKERIDFSRREMEELFKSRLPIQTTGTQAKQRYEFGVPVKGTEGISTELKRNLAEAVKDTQELDAATADYIQELVQLQLQQAKLKTVQKELNDLYKQGKVSQSEYTKATEQIAGAQKSLADDIKLIGERQKEYDALKLAEINSTKAQIIQVEKLKQEYLNLSDAQKQSAFGQDMKAKITSLNTSIKQTQKELDKVNDVAQKSGSTVTKFFGGAWSYLRKLAYILPGFGIAGIISAISTALGKLIFGSGGFEQAIERIKNSLSGLSDEQIKQRKVVDNAASSYARAVSLIAELKANIDLAKGRYLKTDEVLKQFNETFGKTAGHAKNLQEAEKKLTDQGQAYIEMTLQKAVATAAMEEAGKKAFEIEKMRAKQQEEFLTTGDKFMSNAARNAYAMGGASLQQAANETADKMRSAMAKKRKEETIKEAEEEQDVYKQIFLKAQKQAADISKAFKLKFYDGDDAEKSTKAQTELNNLLEKRRDFLKSIVSLERDAKQSGMVQKEKETDKINEKYDKQIELIDELNKEYSKLKPKASEPLIGDAEKERINAARAVETTNQAYRQDAENYIAHIDEKKAAFDALEKVKKDGTLEELAYTRNLYKAQVGEFDNYIDYLKSQIVALSVISLTAPLNVGQITILKELRERLSEATKEQNQKIAQDQANAFNDLIQLSNAYTDKRIAIENKFTQAERTLEETKGNISKELYKERLEGLKNQKQEELKVISDDFLKTTDAYKDFSKGIEDKSISATKKLLEALKALREEMKAAGKDLTTIDNAIKETSSSTSNNEYQDDPKYLQRIKNIQNALSALYGEMNFQITKTLTITGQQIQQTISQVITLLDKDSSKQGKQASLIGLLYTLVDSVVDVATSALKTQKDMASGLEPSVDFAKQATTEIDAQNDALNRQRKLIDDLYGQDRINGLLNLQDQLQKKQEETFAALKKLSIDAIVKQGEYYVDSLFHGQGEWARADNTAGKIFKILNDPLGFIPKTVRVELETVDTSGFNTIEDFVQLLSDIKSQGGTFNGKLVVEDDIKALEELIANYDDLVDKQKELKQQLQGIFTATTAGSIADGIIEGFKQGKRTMEDFADNFQDLMRDAILNSLKYQTLEAPLHNFYDQFAQLSASDGLLTSDEINQLSGIYGDIIKKTDEQVENLKKITGIDLFGTGDESNSLKGAIKGMTEQQAELLAGQFGAVRMTALDHLNVARTSLDTLNKIETNTYQIHEVKNILRRMEINGVKVI